MGDSPTQTPKHIRSGTDRGSIPMTWLIPRRSKKSGDCLRLCEAKTSSFELLLRWLLFGALPSAFIPIAYPANLLFIVKKSNFCEKRSGFAGRIGTARSEHWTETSPPSVRRLRQGAGKGRARFSMRNKQHKLFTDRVQFYQSWKHLLRLQGILFSL